MYKGYASTIGIPSGVLSCVFFLLSAVFLDYHEWTYTMLCMGPCIMFWKLFWYYMEREASHE